MNDNLQRIAIAESTGWTQVRSIPEEGHGYMDTRLVGLHPEQADKSNNQEWIPSYLTDLDAMHEAEKSLAEYPSRERDEYVYALWEVIQRDMSTAYGNRVQSLLHATAAQRAEAFLRTIGKWQSPGATTTPTP